jgi:iron complex outermembrane receptor protein
VRAFALRRRHPATLPDGQGQTSNIDIARSTARRSAARPFSALYGNSSGGVIQSFTETGEGPPTLGFSLAGGSYGTMRIGSQVSGSSGAVDYLLSGSHFETDGYRDHSVAERESSTARWAYNLEDGSRLTLILNSVKLSAQTRLGPHGRAVRAGPAQRRGRHSVQHPQDRGPDAGRPAVRASDRCQQRAAPDGLWRPAQDHVSTRPFRRSAQVNPLSAGGVIGLSRDYGGVDLRWISQMTLAGRPFELVAGLVYDDLREQRTGYENFIGRWPIRSWACRERLRPHETNTVDNLDPYVQATWRLADQWTLEAGVRRSQGQLRLDRSLHRGRDRKRQRQRGVHREPAGGLAALPGDARPGFLYLGGAWLRDADAKRVVPIAPTARAGSTSRCSPRATTAWKWGAKPPGGRPAHGSGIPTRNRR